MIRFHHQAVALIFALLAALPGFCAAAVHEVGPHQPLVLPIAEVLGGIDIRNNAKNNPAGGYCSVYDQISQFSYPSTHANQLGNTALVNDHVYWDSSPGGLDYTKVPKPDAGGGQALWWPIPGEWVSYQFTVTTAGSYTVLTRFSSSWGPGQAVKVQLMMDGAPSGPVPLAPDDAKLWSDTSHQVGGWWGHTMVSGTCPVAWSLSAGTHVLKPVATAKLAGAMAAFKSAGQHEAKGQLGQALTAYEKAAAGSQPGSDQLEASTTKAGELRASFDHRLAEAKELPPAEARVALQRLATDYAGSALAATAQQAMPVAPTVAPTLRSRPGAP